MKICVLLVATACSFVALSTEASAAPSTCDSARMTPTAKQIPANLPGFAYTATSATLSDVHLFAVGATRTEVALTLGKIEDQRLQFLPAAPLVPNTLYELQFSDTCTFPVTPHKPPLSFTASTAAPLPTSFGTEKVPTKGAAAPNYQFSVEGDYLLSAEMKPWKDVYEYVFLIDNEQTFGAIPKGGADDVVLTVQSTCTASMAAKTTHTVQLSAKLAFAPPLDPIKTTVDFTCTLPPPPSTSGTSGSSSSGCSVGRPGSSPLSIIAIAFGLAAARRLRRRRRGSANYPASAIGRRGSVPTVCGGVLTRR